MSYYSWHTYGYGVRTDDIKVKSLEALQSLVALAPQTERNFKNWFEENSIENPTLEDYYEYEQYDTCHLASVLRLVILETEGILLTDCNNLDDEDYLVYQPLYPWELNDVDKSMTRENLESIFHKYLSIITDEIPRFESQEVENGG